MVSFELLLCAAGSKFTATGTASFIMQPIPKGQPKQPNKW